MAGEAPRCRSCGGPLKRRSRYGICTRTEACRAEYCRLHSRDWKKEHPWTENKRGPEGRAKAAAWQRRWRVEHPEAYAANAATSSRAQTERRKGMKALLQAWYEGKITAKELRAGAIASLFIRPRA